MPTHFQLSWVRAVKEWNQNQAFQEDIYAIPKKGGESYKEVVSLREEFKRQHNAPQISEAEAKVEAKPEPRVEPKPEPKVEPKPEPKPEPEPEPKVDAVKEYSDFLQKLKTQSSGQTIKGLRFDLTKEENKELDEIARQSKEKGKNVKTQDDLKAYQKEQTKIMDKFKDRVKQRNREDNARAYELKKASDKAQGIVEKPFSLDNVASFTFGDVFGKKKT